jgi:molybdate transport system regulatory protein
MGGRAKKAMLRTISAQLRIEADGKPAMTEAGADLLDQIDACGSLSEAGRRLGFSYRKAWMLLDAMNTRWPRALATTAIGGRKGGGAKLTELGRHVLTSYRDLQLRLEHALDLAGDPFKPIP